jgi:serine/threonine-protein kinase
LILESGNIIANRYEIIEKIGQGGMAIVYKTKDLKLEREVTFKVMREEYTEDEDFIKRFNIEARSAASLSHPNIVSVYDVGQEGLIYYIVMEYIDGMTLADLINRKAPFSSEEVLGVGIQIAKALQSAHNNKIIHRDIKPRFRDSQKG